MKNKYIKFFYLFLILFSSCIHPGNEQEENVESKVLVAAHRGDWRGYADNSLEGIESCIRMGVDIVEIDLALTKDSILILMHDRTVDRTTSGKGKVEDLTYAEISELRLRNGLGRTGEFMIPTLEEVMLLCKDRILVNIDKADVYFDEVYKILEQTGTTSQAIIKSEKPYTELKETFGQGFEEMLFMPILVLNENTKAGELQTTIDKKYPYYEIVFRDADHPLLPEVIASLKENGSTIWINSLWPSLCGGLSDDRALKSPENTWGRLIEEFGAGILQTDRPQFMLEWLKEKGYRP